MAKPYQRPSLDNGTDRFPGANNALDFAAHVGLLIGMCSK